MARAPRRLAGSPFGARVLGAIIIVGGLTGLAVDRLAQDTLREGTGPLITRMLGLAMVVLGLTQMIWPHRRAAIVTVLMVGGDLVWAGFAWAAVDPITRANPIFLGIMAVAVGLLLGRWAVLVKFPITAVALAIGLSPVLHGGRLWFAVATHTLLFGAVTLSVHHASRRIEDLLAQISHLSGLDPLTDLPNRRELERRMPGLTGSVQERGGQVCAVVLDLDHFKQVNDTHGHAIGDAVLVGTARRLHRLGAEDVVAARLGGEEFIVLARVVDERQARRLADDVHALVATADTPVAVTCSVGVTTSPPPAADADLVAWGWWLIARADRAMYRAKRSGRDRVVEDFGERSGQPGAGRSADAPSRLRRPAVPQAPLDVRGCPAPGHSRAGHPRDRDGYRLSIMIGRMAFAGVILVWLDLMLTGSTSTTTSALHLAAMGYLALLAGAFRGLPRLGSRLVPFLPPSAVGLWITMVAGQPSGAGVQAAGSMVLPAALAAAWFTGARSLAATLVAVSGALVGLQYLAPGPNPAYVVASGTVVITLVSVSLYAVRRRGDHLLATVQALSDVDPLTGLANRRHLEDHVATLVGQCRQAGTELAVLQIDLDHFKQINDTFGHDVGDAVLRAMGGVLSGVLGPHDVAGRVGGEELVLLAEVDGVPPALALAETIRTEVAGACSDPRMAPGMSVTCSIGVAVAAPPPHAVATEWFWQLTERADVALYRAKADGRDRTRLAADPDPVPGRPTCPDQSLTSRAAR